MWFSLLNDIRVFLFNYIKKRIDIGVINKQHSNEEENNILPQKMEVTEAVPKRRNESCVPLDLDYPSEVEDKAIDSQTEHKRTGYMWDKKV